MTRFASNALFALTAMLLITSGCATRSMDPIMLRQAQVEIPQHELINVVIAPLATGVPTDPAEIEDDVFPEVRKAESRYLAMLLKRTVESSGHWGSVNVAPATDDVGLSIRGEILESDGESLALLISASDATGRSWIVDEYRSRLPVEAYRTPSDEQREPFQNLFNRISNDLVEAREELSDGQRAEVGQVAELRFAANLAPDSFGDRLETDRKGSTRVVSLPARDDSMLARVRAIQDRDLLLRETLDESYADFYEDMREPYHRWRSFTAEEVVLLRSVNREAYSKVGLGVLAVVGGIVLSTVSPGLASELLSGPLVLGGIYGTTLGIQKFEETSIHSGAIEELGNSFEADVTPRVIQVEGETVRITGNAEAQYQEWRRLLSAIYQAETGLPVANPIGGPDAQSVPAMPPSRDATQASNIE